MRAATAARARMPSAPIRRERHCKCGRRFGYSLRPGLPFICPVMVIDPTYLGATVVVARALCLTSYNLSLTQKTCLFTDGHQARVCAVRRGSTRASASYRATRNRFLLWFLKSTRLFLSPYWGPKRPISSLDSQTDLRRQRTRSKNGQSAAEPTAKCSSEVSSQVCCVLLPSDSNAAASIASAAIAAATAAGEEVSSSTNWQQGSPRKAGHGSTGSKGVGRAERACGSACPSRHLHTLFAAGVDDSGHCTIVSAKVASADGECFWP